MIDTDEVRFITKKGRQALIRPARLEDLEAVTTFINDFSLENSFTRFAGEQLTLDEEREYLTSELELMAKGDAVKLFCFVAGAFAGVCDVHRDTSLLTRKRHVGKFGLIIGKPFRGEGVGERLARETILRVEKMPGITLISLTCFATNTPALSLYRKIGFAEVGRVPGVLWRNDAHDDEVIMLKKTDIPAARE